ncbi:MAG: hypothetical protein ABW189_04120 [Rickettsiales bacterium]
MTESDGQVRPGAIECRKYFFFENLKYARSAMNDESNDDAIDAASPLCAETQEHFRRAAEALTGTLSLASALRGKFVSNDNGNAHASSAFDVRLQEEAIDRVCRAIEETQLHMCRTALEWHYAQNYA